MTVSLLLWLSCIVVTIGCIAALNWLAARRVRRAMQADHLHREERSRVLSIYARVRDGRCYHPQRFPESVYAAERPQRGRR